MTHRIIHFKQQALLDPETYQAMLADGVGHWERLAGEVVGIEDEKSHEFAALKSLFKRKRYSYDTLEMREPGDHSNWLRGRRYDQRGHQYPRAKRALRTGDLVG